MATGKGQSAKDSAMAARMKDQGIIRTGFQCPMSCGRILPIYRESALIDHLGKCRGKHG